MSTDTAAFETKVRREWIDDATTAAWRKWHVKSVPFWSGLTHALLSFSDLKPGQRVLDLASGTGDPALTIAGQVGDTGHVVITDLAPQMVEIARDNAHAAGVTNVSFATADVHRLPFADASFDRVTCRLGVMFFWDCGGALREIRRVLKPGGIASFVAWGPVEQNEYMRTVMAPFKKRQSPPAPAPGAPQPYRFASPGSLSAELHAAGFSAVREQTEVVPMVWPGTAAELWTRLHEVSAPMRPYFDSFPVEVRAEAIREAIAGLEKYADGRHVVTRAAIVVAAATR
jgi:ubiquinone/menaquinone biosynthesis C-methylase UbiE